MMRFRCATWCSFFLSLTGGATHAAETWRAGAATVRITPDRPMWLSGYAGRTKPAEGTLSDLNAKALILEDPSGRRAVIVTMDLVGISREFASAVCMDLK